MPSRRILISSILAGYYSSKRSTPEASISNWIPAQKLLDWLRCSELSNFGDCLKSGPIQKTIYFITTKAQWKFYVPVHGCSLVNRDVFLFSFFFFFAIQKTSGRVEVNSLFSSRDFIVSRSDYKKNRWSNTVVYRPWRSVNTGSLRSRLQILGFK